MIGKAVVWGGLVVLALSLLLLGLEDLRTPEAPPGVREEGGGLRGFPFFPLRPLAFTPLVSLALFVAVLVGLRMLSFRRNTRWGTGLLGLLLFFLLLLVFWNLREVDLESKRTSVPAPSMTSPLAPVGPTDSPSPAQVHPGPFPWAYLLLTLVLPVAFLFYLHLKPKRSSGSASQSLGEIAAGSRHELEMGIPLEEVVVRCWARMAELLGPKVPHDLRFLTPRELAAALAKRGISHPAIIDLTRLFEEVRYGDRGDLSRRERALKALRALEEEYGAEGP